MKKQYTRDEKIAYWKAKIVYAEKRIKYLSSEAFQDWDSDLQHQLAALHKKLAIQKKKRKGA